MMEYNFTDVNRASGTVLENAQKGIVGLKQRGQVKIYMVPADQMPDDVVKRLEELHMLRLKENEKTQAVKLEDLPQDALDALEEGINQALER